MSVKAIIFDLDGTLANSLEDLADAVNFTLKKFGCKTHELGKYNGFVGDGMKMLLLRAFGTDINKFEYQEVYNVFIKRYSEHFCDKTRVYYNELQIIERLQELNIKIAVVTNKVDFMAKAVVEKLYGKNKFCAVLGQSEEYPTKPNPEIVFKALNIMKVKPEECIFVGDSNIDIITGHNAGMKSVGVLWGFRTKEELKAAGADYIINNPNELLSVLN